MKSNKKWFSWKSLNFTLQLMPILQKNIIYYFFYHNKNENKFKYFPVIDNISGWSSPHPYRLPNFDSYSISNHKNFSRLSKKFLIFLSCSKFYSWLLIFWRWSWHLNFKMQVDFKGKFTFCKLNLLYKKECLLVTRYFS